VKQDQAIANNERKSQGVASARPGTPSNRESGNPKGEEKKKSKSGKLAHSAGQGK
jgi:hypothetical protein